MSNLYLRPNYFFGKTAMHDAIKAIKNQKYTKALILYGGGSVKKNGSYNDLVYVLNLINLPFVEFSGIEPNPHCDTVDKCVEFARLAKIDVIFAIGGGSVIDASKVIGVLINNPHYKDCWQYCLDQSSATNDSVDIVSIITLAGTASENNCGSVITNPELKEKKGGIFNVSATPKIAIENPIYTYSVNKWQTASGIFDCFSHLMEQYFGYKTFDWTKNYLFANMKTLVKWAKIAVDEPNNYEARANVLWTTSMALNGIGSFECETDWSVHTIEHAFSGLWDITHGAGLAFVTPTYLILKGDEQSWFKQKVVEMGINVFNTNDFDSTINALLEFIKSIYLPTKWTEFKEITKFESEEINFLVQHANKFNKSISSPVFIKKVIEELANLK
ncbi:MAG: iron-containing alcohol dehydrogenase [Malacoplasma sp.]|nr:iron-containing alcohol dehydrogenase [Malacoplasma sp.]